MHRAIRIAFFFALVYCIIYAEINNRDNQFACYSGSENTGQRFCA